MIEFNYILMNREKLRRAEKYKPSFERFKRP